MFRSPATRRRQASASTRRRRLGVELMEGRLMLSVNGPGVPQPEVRLVQDTFAPPLIYWTGAQFTSVTQSNDGGFIQGDVTFDHYSRVWQRCCFSGE